MALRGASLKSDNLPMEREERWKSLLYIAGGSLFEVLTLTELFSRRRLLSSDQYGSIRQQAELIDRKLHGLINSIKSRQ